MFLSLKPFAELIVRKIKLSSQVFHKNRNETFWYFLGFLPIERPLAGIVLCSLQLMVFDALNLPDKMDKYFSMFVKALGAYYLIKLIYLAVEAFGQTLNAWISHKDYLVDSQMGTFATKSLKVLVVILGVLVIVQNFGVNVMSILAGLGLGGLALALAAQDTAANLFGSITILLDRPFKIGDWIKVTDSEGTVEEIGFRSTRIRTFYNSIITIPNSVMAKEKIDNLGERPYRRLRHNVGLHYDSSPQQIEDFCNQVQKLLMALPQVQKDSINVFFNGYGDSALNILINVHVEVFSGDDELQLQQKILLEVMLIAENLKLQFAYPTRTVYVKNI
ncbi:MAG: mechanosensitive ion channel family protein [Pseudobdellovibrionaceae bacterium]